MRNALLATTILFLGQTAVLAQSADWANKMFSATKQVEVVTHNFGSVPRGAQLFHRFPMKNVWTVPIDILEVRASCGCVTPTVTKTHLEPQESGFLECKMDARRFTGDKTVTVFVKVGPQYISTASVRVSARSRADVVFNPGQVTFGVVQSGLSPTVPVDVEYAGVLDWQVSEVLKNGAPVDVRIEELYRQPGQVGYRVHVTLRSDAPAGALKKELLLKTNDPASPVVPLLVEANIQAPLMVTPEVVNLRSPRIGESVTAAAVVRSQSNRPFHVLSIEGLGEGLEADLPRTATSVQIVRFKYTAPKAGDVKRELKIKTDLDGESTVTVKVEAIATTAP